MKRIDEFNERYFPADGVIEWPIDPDARQRVARTILGLGFVGAHDAWIAHARSMLDPRGEPLAKAFAEEAAIRATLGGMDPAQRRAVEGLVRLAVHGALFSALVSIDQFPRATLRIEVQANDGEFESVPVAPAMEDLHDEFLDWLEEFSEEATGPS